MQIPSKSLSFSFLSRSAPGVVLTLLLVASGLLAAMNAGAVVVDNLYRAQVGVEGRDDSARDEGFEKALSEVLVRITGTRTILDDEDIESLLKDARELADAYQYVDVDDELKLRVTFSASGVSRALADLDQAVWGANRPAVLVWFVTQERSGREVIQRDDFMPGFLEESGKPVTLADRPDDGPWKAALLDQATRRGVPLLLPFFDEQDRDHISVSEIWGQFHESIDEASERYRPDRIAVVRVNERGGDWQARWELRSPGSDDGISGEVRESEHEALVASLVDAWAGHFSDVFAVAPGDVEQQQRLELVVSGVDSMTGYASVRRALLGMEPVREAEPGAVKGNQLRLRLSLSGDLTLLREYVALDQRFEMMAGPADESLGREAEDASAWLLEEEGEAPESEESRFANLYPTLYYRWVTDADEEEDEVQAVDEDALRIIEPLESDDADSAAPGF